MDKRNYTYAQLGMLFGIFIGGGLGVVLFTSTGQVLYIAIAGADAAIGLIIGAGIDRYRQANDGQAE